MCQHSQAISQETLIRLLLVHTWGNSNWCHKWCFHHNSNLIVHNLIRNQSLKCTLLQPCVQQECINVFSIIATFTRWALPAWWLHWLAGLAKGSPLLPSYYLEPRAIQLVCTPAVLLLQYMPQDIHTVGYALFCCNYVTSPKWLVGLIYLYTSGVLH